MWSNFSLLRLGVNCFQSTLLPFRCEVCGQIASDRGVCFMCFQKLSMISENACFSCGLPFPVSTDKEAKCFQCEINPPLFRRMRSVFVYNKSSRALVLRFKTLGVRRLLPFFSKLLFLRAKEMLGGVDIITAVPLHWTRLLTRHFNQSDLLAYGLAQASSYPFLKLIKKIKPTRSQGGLTLKERKKNMKQAFYIIKQHATVLRDKRILLVDDVCTTGATLNACTAVLLKHGAQEVSCLTLARTMPSRAHIF